ncbi:MAG: hypothetical protein Q8877_02540, partial [Sweet potato little leaf phytoplasma]|nr:hypothetical protein [Sweet potato little leaf phytoplasma]
MISFGFEDKENKKLSGGTSFIILTIKVLIVIFKVFKVLILKNLKIYFQVFLDVEKAIAIKK